MDSPLPKNETELPRSLEHFRAKTKRLKIHPLETALLWVVSLHFIFLPWAIGGMRVWSQWISFALAVAEFALALVPRHYTEEHTGANSFRLIMRPRAARFPLFWLGLALLIYVALQALNPSWEYRTDGKVWWLKRLDEIPWLPTGVSVPFELWGPGREP